MLPLAPLLATLRRVAPEDHAESWDRIGLQLGNERQRIHKALLCIDLTEPVLAEARALGANLIVAYHPPIFRPLTGLREDRGWKERLLVEAVRRRIAVYSPHTALDSVPGGLTDWLCAGLGAGAIVERIGEAGSAGDDEPAAGRVYRLRRPVRPALVARRLRERLAVEHLKVALPAAAGARVTTVAVCPGAGGAVFERGAEADAYVTGEMQHHQVLDLVSRGKIVLLAGHANTERPFLGEYRRRLVAAGGDGVEWHLSTADRSPIVIG